MPVLWWLDWPVGWMQKHTTVRGWCVLRTSMGHGVQWMQPIFNWRNWPPADCTVMNPWNGNRNGQAITNAR
jgi:hypothetical protein